MSGVRYLTPAEAWAEITRHLEEMRFRSVNDLEDNLDDPRVRWHPVTMEIDSLLWLIDPDITLELDD